MSVGGWHENRSIRGSLAVRCSISTMAPPPRAHLLFPGVWTRCRSVHQRPRSGIVSGHRGDAPRLRADDRLASQSVAGGSHRPITGIPARRFGADPAPRCRDRRVFKRRRRRRPVRCSARSGIASAHRRLSVTGCESLDRDMLPNSDACDFEGRRRRRDARDASSGE
jgi:hypothetical protein